MGTTYEITIDGFNDNASDIKASVDSLLLDINNIFSTYIIDSEISNINNFKEYKQISISKDFYNVLKKSLYYCHLSNGSYDVTVAPLVELWGFGKNIYIDKGFLRKKNNSLSIDLNSIAKGYAVDEVYHLLKEYGYENFLVEIGGELRSSNTKEYNWYVGIANPFSSTIINKIRFIIHSE